MNRLVVLCLGGLLAMGLAGGAVWLRRETLHQDRLALGYRSLPSVGYIWSRGDAELAREFFGRALDLRPGDARALRGLAWAELWSGDPEACLGVLDRLAGTERPGGPRDAGDRCLRAAALVRLGRDAEAMAELQAVEAGQPADVRSALLAAWLRADSSDTAVRNASRGWTELLRLAARHPFAYAADGSLLYLLAVHGGPQELSTALSQAVEGAVVQGIITPGSVDGLRGLFRYLEQAR